MSSNSYTKINDKAQYRIVLAKYLPENSIEYVIRQVEKYSVILVFTRPRYTKKGTFSINAKRQRKITLNGGMSKAETLLVFLHELAHLMTYEMHGFRVKSHGAEWQQQFIGLLKQACAHQFFEEALCAIIEKCYFGNKTNSIATQCKDLQLYFNPKTGLLLQDIEPDTRFCLKMQPSRCFLLKTHRRTRSLCEDLKTGKQYLVNKLVEIVKYDADISS